MSDSDSKADSLTSKPVESVASSSTSTPTLTPVVYHAQCYCESVQFTLHGPPLSSIICHCVACRHYHSASPVYVIQYADDEKSLIVTKGKEFLTTAKRTEEQQKRLPNSMLQRVFCSQCGSKLWNHFGKFFFTFPSLVDNMDFKPQCHVNYESTKCRMKDGLTKFKNFPPTSGGSGEVMEE